MDDNNYVELIGKLKTGFYLSHVINGESFYYMTLEVVRTSGTIDIVRLLLSDKIILLDDDIFEKYVFIKGVVKTHNKKCNDSTHLIMSVFVEELEVLDVNGEEILNGTNIVKIDGYICKKYPIRETPQTGRKITDIIVAVNNQYGRSYYLPCVCWNKNAISADKLNVGTEIKIDGRMQSREYIKNGESKIAYEISVQSMDTVQ